MYNRKLRCNKYSPKNKREQIEMVDMLKKETTMIQSRK